MNQQPIIIQGGSHTDHRGTIVYVNDFQFEGVKRYYTIHHPDTHIVRAWQGHTQEAKYYYPVKGSWVVAWVKMEFDKPEEEWQVEYRIMKAEDNQLLYIPPGFANGFKALEPDSIVTGFSVPGSEEETLMRWKAETWLDWERF